MTGKSFIAGAALLFLPWVAWPQQLPTLVPPRPSPEAAAGVTFEDATQASGLSEFRHVAGSPAKPYLPETLGSGVALFDFDNDGWLDVYLVNALPRYSRQEGSARAALFRNNHDGTFSDVTAAAGVENRRWGMGVCAGDIDNDGWEDLYVTNFGKSRLYKNKGDGTFVDIAAGAGVQVDGWATGCAFGDYNGDGLLDLYVARYVDFDWDHPPPAGGGDAAAAPSAERKDSTKTPSMGAAYDPKQSACLFYGVRVACGPMGLKAAPDVLFRNEGNRKFIDVTRASGIAKTQPRYGLAVGWVDIDDDGLPDIVVANDSNPNFLFHNQGDGTFEEAGVLSGLGTNGDGHEQAYMGMAVGDYDHDGRADFFFTTFSGDNYSLFRNAGKVDFSDTSLQAGLAAITMPFLGWGTAFIDYDNDGWPDLFAANGHIFPQADPATWGTSYGQRPLLLRNTRNGRFVDVSGSAGAVFAKPRSARGAAFGDLFNRGAIDIVLNDIDNEPALLRNGGAEAAGHWLSVKLVGDPAVKTPRDAIGAVVFCTANGFRQRGEVASGRSYLSQSDLQVHFGLGDASEVEKLEVRWPGGQQEIFEKLGVNQALTIRQGQGIQPDSGGLRFH